MKRNVALTAALVVVAWAFLGQSFGLAGMANTPLTPIPLLPTFSIPSLQTSNIENVSAQVLAWTVWEDYLEFAKAHDLQGLKSVSHQTSAICNDPAKEVECFALMDGIASLAGKFTFAEFKHVASDARQIIIYTDGPEQKILYFTRGPSGIPKVLGLKVCLEDENNPEMTCEMLNVDTKDDDGDGWWNSTESLFYK